MSIGDVLAITWAEKSSLNNSNNNDSDSYLDFNYRFGNGTSADQY